jgi:putative flippase GtrA
MPQFVDKLPPALANRLRTRLGRQFTRFALVAVISLAASELTLSVALLLGDATGGVATLLGWLVGAITSYVLSRWAWQRKGRPDLLKETLPFWIISAGTAVVLTTTGHISGKFANHHHLPDLEKVALVGGAYLVMNFVTFVTRFLIFHYVLFADRTSKDGGRTGAAEPVDAESVSEALGVVTVPAATDQAKQQPRP